MKVDLLQHNQAAYEKIQEIFKTNNKTCIVQPTGSGKSYLMLKLVEDYVNDNRDIVIIEPQRYIFDQLKEKMDKYGLPKDKVKFITYSALGKMDCEKIKKFTSPCMVIVDEMHRAGAHTWIKGIQLMFTKFPADCKYLGLSATPIRYLDGKRNMCEELFDGCVANEISLADAILNRILPLPRYIAGLYTYENEINELTRKIHNSCNSADEKKELLEEVKLMKRNLDKSEGISSIFKKYIVSDNGKYVAFCRDITHLKEMRECLEQWFSDVGIKANMYEVHYKNPNKNEDFASFKEDKNLAVCLSVGMLSEGVHGIDGVILLRDTVSPNLYYQQIGRAFAVEMESVPVIFDMVANCESVMDCGLKADLMKAIDKRDKETKDRVNIGDSGEITKKDIEKFFVFDQVLDAVSAFKEIEGRLSDYYNDWTEKEINILRYFFPLIGGREVIKQNLLPRHTLNSVMAKAYKLNLRFCERGKYIPNKTDDKVLIDNYKNLGRKEILKLLPHMTENQVRHRAKQLGLYFDNKKWTEDEIKLLNKYYLKLPIKELIKRLGRSRNSIISQACKLGLTLDRSVIWTKEEDNRLTLLYPKLGPRIFDEFPGKTKNQLQKRLGILNVKMDSPFETKMQLARQAVSEGVILDCKNQYYQNVNLYDWKIYNKNNFTNEEMEILERLIPYNKRLIPVKIIDLEDDNNSRVYSSISDAAKVLHCVFGIGKSERGCVTVIRNRLTGKAKNLIFKGRFRFEYAEDTTA